MRDLKADLEICNRATQGPWKCLDDTPVDPEWANIFPQDLDFVMESREGWPHAIERAIKAEEKLSKIREVFKYRRCKNCLHYYNPVCPMDDVVIEDELTDESYCSWFCAKAE